MNYKTCKQCGQCKPYTDFYSTPTGGPFARCKLCCIANRRARYLANPVGDHAQARQRLLADPRVRMAAAARRRDKAKGLASDIQATHITIPKLCPVLGIPLVAALGKACAGSPSIDHLDPTKGAVIGNWRVISYRANALKGDHTAETLAHFIARIERPEEFAGTRRATLRGGTTLDEYRAVLAYLRAAPVPP